MVPLRLREPGKVAVYVCGLTVDGEPHLGHGRMALVFDVLRRYLVFTGLDVTYVSNITDIDDKIIDGAAAAGLPIDEFTAVNEARWWEIVEALGVLVPDEIPHATAYVDQMIALVRDLVAREVAYETPTGVYLSVLDVPGYGLLARQPLESLPRGHGSKPTRTSGRRSTSCSGRRPSRASRVGTRPGGPGGPDGTPNAW